MGVIRTAPGDIAGVRPRTDRPSVFRSPLAWVVTAFFGLQAFVAFAVMGWLPQVLMDAGARRGDAGLLLGLLSIVALPISLVVPALATRRGGQSGWIVGLSTCGFAGVGGFLLAPAFAPLLWTILLGLGMSDRAAGGDRRDRRPPVPRRRPFRSDLSSSGSDRS